MNDVPDRLREALAEHYQLLSDLGAGGMATVYLAEDVKHQRRVAIKVLRPELSATLGPDRFLHEIHIAARLQHPHILPLLDSGNAGGFLYYVMPYVDGLTLRDKLVKDGELPIHTTVRTLLEVADALAAAHAAGVVHRDIKPENVLLSGKHALVMDFGVAKAVDQATGAHKMTSVGVALGTPSYMAPEQAAAEPNLDHRVDIYALGCMAYELLTGRPPFSGMSAQQVLSAHMTQAPVPPTKHRPAIPPALEQAVLKCLEKRPADRFQSAEELMAVLEPLATPSGGITPTTTRPLSGATIAIRRSRPMMVGAALLVIAVLAVAAAVVSRRPAPVVRFGTTSPVTIDVGLELDPALSPDGATIVYAQGPVAKMGLVVRSVQGGAAVPITKEAGCSARDPQWSPDGSRILFQCDGRIMIVPALGGAPQVLVAEGAAHPAWMPDGSGIAYVANENTVVRRALEGGAVVKLAEGITPHSLRWSPDGSRLVFVTDNDLFLFGTTTLGNLAPSQLNLVSRSGGDAHAITDKKSLHESPVWMPDGRSLLLVSNEGGGRDLFQLPLDGSGSAAGPQVRLTTGLGVGSISMSRTASRIAYTVFSNSANIWSVAIPLAGRVASTRDAVPFTTGNQHIEGLNLSHDGQWMAFDSDRSGMSHIWKVRMSGGEPQQLTNAAGEDFIPTWSGDDKWLAFQTWRNGNRDVYVVPSAGGPAEQVTHKPEHEMYPSWSPDSRSIVYHEPRQGEPPLMFRVDRTAAGWSPAVQLSKGGGALARWSPDGKLIAYLLQRGAMVMASDGSAERMVMPFGLIGTDTAFVVSVSWSSDPATLYVKAVGSRTEEPSFWAVPAAGGAPRLLVRFDDPSRPSGRQEFTTDGKRLYFTVDNRQSDISVMDVIKP